MKKGYIIGIIFIILGLGLGSSLMQNYAETCTQAVGDYIPCTQKIAVPNTFIPTIFYIIGGIGIGMILTTYMSKYKIEKQK